MSIRNFEQIADFRRGGSAELELCQVAAGRLDAYFEANLKPWDHAAGQLIAREGGAISTDFAGEPLLILSNANILPGRTSSVIHNTGKPSVSVRS